MYAAWVGRAVLLLVVGAGVACGASHATVSEVSAPTVSAPRAAEDGGVVDASADASAAASHQTLRLRWSQAWNLHWANQAGAEHANDAGEVTIDLYADGRSRAEDHGKTVSSVLDGEGYDEKVTEWRTTWLGTWQLANGALGMDLTRDKTRCVRVESERVGAQQARPTTTICSAGVDHLELQCEESHVDASPTLDDLTTKPTPTPTWNCHPPGATPNTIGSPFTWVFGKQRCVERIGGTPSAGFRYAFCTPAD